MKEYFDVNDDAASVRTKHTVKPIFKFETLGGDANLLHLAS
jgi:hypothetical protein